MFLSMITELKPTTTERHCYILHFSHISAKLSITSYKLQTEFDNDKLTQPLLFTNQQPITDNVNRLWSYMSKTCRFCPTLTIIPGGGWTVCTKCSIQLVTSVYCDRLSQDRTMNRQDWSVVSLVWLDPPPPLSHLLVVVSMVTPLKCLRTLCKKYLPSTLQSMYILLPVILF
jgi:hypothetical protein